MIKKIDIRKSIKLLLIENSVPAARKNTKISNELKKWKKKKKKSVNMIKIVK